MPTFPKGHHAAQLHREHAKLLAKLVLETGGNVAEEKKRARARWAASAVDSVALRGIPAIGPGVSGARPDARPGYRLFRDG